MINLSKQNECIVFEFSDNQHYLQNGKIEMPVNSMAVIFDNSDMITIRKAASQDILLSANYDDFGMTRAELESWFKTNAFAAGGGSSITEIYTGCPSDYVDPSTGEVHKNECDKKDQLCIVYKSEQGEYSMVKVSLNEFILENEFEDGLSVDSGGTVHGVVDPRPNNKVIIAYDASGNPITSGDVLSVNESGFTTSNIQEAIDAKVDLYHDLYDVVSGRARTDLVESATTLEFYNVSGDALFNFEIEKGKPLSGINGVYVASGASLDIVSGVVDSDSEVVVTEYTISGESALTEEVLSVGEDGFKVDNIQKSIDAKVLIDRRLYTPKEGEYNKSNQEITFKSDLNDELFKVKLSGDTHLDSGSTNFVQNSAITKVILDNEEVVSAALNNLNDRKAEWTSAVTSGAVVTTSSANTLEFYDRSGNTLFDIDLPNILVDAHLSSASTNPVANSAITEAIDDLEERKADWLSAVTSGAVVTTSSANTLEFVNRSGDTLFDIELPNAKPLSGGTNIVITSGDSFDLISVSGSSAITSSSTEVVTSKAIYNELVKKQKRNVEVTQEEYDALVSAGTLDLEVLYLITDADPITNKALSGTSGVYVQSGETIDVISGTVDALSEQVVISYTPEGLSAATDDVLSVGVDGFKVDNIQKAINALHSNVIKLSGYTSGVTEDIFSIQNGDTITQAFEKIENKLYKDADTGIIFDENSDEIIVLNGGTY